MMDDQCKWSVSVIPNTFCQKWVLSETSDNQSEIVKIRVIHSEFVSPDYEEIHT